MPKDIIQGFPFEVWTRLELMLFDLEPQLPSLALVLTGHSSQVIYPPVSLHVMETLGYPTAPPGLWVLWVQCKNFISPEAAKIELSAAPWQKFFCFTHFLEKPQNQSTNLPKNLQFNQTKQIPTQIVYPLLEGNQLTAS